MSKYAKLSRLWALRQFCDGRLVLMNRKYPMTVYPGETEAYVLKNCDGQNDFDSFAFLPKHRNVLRKLEEQGIAADCSKGEKPEKGQIFRALQNPLLTEIHWAITGYCNMNCPHCFMEAPEKRYGEVTMDEARRAIGQFEKAGAVRVSLTGGEPLLHPHFREIVDEICRHGLIVSQIVTNGSLLDRSLFDFLHERDLWPEIQISLDGIGTHDEMRGTENMEGDVLRGIELAVSSGHDVSVCTLFTKRNMHTAMRTYEWLRDTGVIVWMVSRPQQMGMWKGGREALSTSEIAELCLALKKKWDDDGRRMTIGLEKFFNGNAAEAIKTRECIDSYTPESPECPTTLWKIFLLPDGTLLPCTGYTGSKLMQDMPNIYSEELSEAWNSSGLRSFVCRRKKDRLAHIPECAACEFFEKCGAGCGAYALTENGSSDAPDPFICALYKGGWKDKFNENTAGRKPDDE